MKKINIDDIKVSSKLDDIIKEAVNDGYKGIGNKKNKRSIIAATLAVALGATVFGISFGDEVIATVKLAMFDIGDYLRGNKGLEDYKTVINRAVSKNGITVQLNEVILDKDEVIVSTTAMSEQNLGQNGSINLSGDVYINGKRISSAAGGSSKQVDEHTEETVLSYKLDDVIPSGDIAIEIKYDKSYLFIDGKSKNIRGPWKFEFRGNGDALSGNTDSVELNNSFVLENGQKVIINEYRSNDVGQKIYYSLENKEKDNAYSLVLRGYDDLGKEVEFYSCATRS